jgi:hypothetical protein
MILSGMGPLISPVTAGGKLFAGFYALYSGLAVLVIAGVIFAPVVHRFLHRFHMEARGRLRFEVPVKSKLICAASAAFALALAVPRLRPTSTRRRRPYGKLLTQYVTRAA